MCQFIETIKISQGCALHLEFHQTRINRTFAHFFGDQRKQKPPNLEEVLLASLPKTGEWRARILYDTNILEVNFFPIVHRKFNRLRVIEANPNYDYKYANRDELLALLSQKENADEILIVRKGLITDTSISNVCFFDGSHWFTPQHPLLPGTTRARLLQEGKIYPRNIQIEEILNEKYKKMRLINALMDFEDAIDIALPNGVNF